MSFGRPLLATLPFVAIAGALYACDRGCQPNFARCIDEASAFVAFAMDDLPLDFTTPEIPPPHTYEVRLEAPTLELSTRCTVRTGRGPEDSPCECDPVDDADPEDGPVVSCWVDLESGLPFVGAHLRVSAPPVDGEVRVVSTPEAGEPFEATGQLAFEEVEDGDVCVDNCWLGELVSTG